jgi:microsomal dipeptidase-like Zn-dependent dipeptidase
MRRIGLALLLAALLAAPAHAQQTKYSIAGGCYEVASGGPAGPYRLKATTLAQYLLYTKDEQFLTPDGPAGAPSEAAEWTAAEEGGAVKLSSLAGGNPLTLGKEATGCPEYPEVALNVEGAPFSQPVPYGETRGFLEAHIHMMAFEFLGGSLHCGRPWHEYGAPYALRDCEDHIATGGCGAAIEGTLGGNPGCHDTGGWPTFAGWPEHDQITHEQTYYRWLERAWRGGLRTYVNLFVENGVLCELYPLKRNSCDEMDSVRLQARDIYELQDYIDAQNGGPGKGFFRIVTDPFQARKVIADGKLAVVLGIEVSHLFNCEHFNYEPTCNVADIDRQLEEVHKLGVRDMELVNKYDNALAGVAGDGGAAGPVVNNGNKYETNKYWEMKTCQTTEGDKEQPGVPRDVLVIDALDVLLPDDELPVYTDPAPHCNVRGLTDLGEYVVREMMERGMIVDPDHLSQAARDELLAVTESKDYSGLVSSHSWSNDKDYPRIMKSGGVIAPNDNNTKGYLENWKRLRKQRAKRYFYGIGYGADMNGFSSSAGPIGDEVKIAYPFKTIDGNVTVQKQESGERTFDINEDGIAHYGLFPDWIEALRKLGGKQIVDDMANGTEAYLQMWERAAGVPGPSCRARTARLRSQGVRQVHVGLAYNTLLRRAGQPQQRRGRVWRWCVNGRDIRKVRVTAVLTPRGRSALVATNARGQRAAKIGVGDKLKRVRPRTKPFGRGLRIRPAGGGRRFLYGIRRGRVAFAAVATRVAAKSPATARRYLKLGGVR